MDTLMAEYPASKVEGLVGFKELAAQFASTVPASWLKRLANDGTLPCLRLGAKTLYSISAVKARLAELAAQPSPRKAKATATVEA